MSKFAEDLSVIYDELKRQREVLALKMHLASADVKDEWQQLEKQWQQFSGKADRVVDELKDSSEDVEADLKRLGADLKRHYEKLKQILD